MIDSFSPINPALIDQPLNVESGYPLELAAGDTTDVMLDMAGDASRAFPPALWIEPSDWADKARDNDKYGTWPANYIDRFTNQNPTHECTCHALRASAECARNRALGVSLGPAVPKQRLDTSGKHGSVWLSPLSIYAEANPRQWGGASCRGVMEIAIRRGFLPEPIQPREYGFRHTLHGTTGTGGINQAKGSWTSVANFPSGWQETAKHFRILEVIFPTSAEQIVCLILHGYCVEVGRSGHAIPYWRFNPVQKVMGYADSYDVERFDSWNTVRSAVGGAFAVASMTMPDDRMKPAG